MLSGRREADFAIHAKHSDMCRFDLSKTQSKADYDVVESRISRLCNLVGEPKPPTL